MSCVLVVSPHVDDETLGAGGTLLRYKNQNKRVYWLNFTNMKIEYGYTKEQVNKRKEEIEQVIKEYKFDGFFDLGLKPANLEQYNGNEIIKKVSNIINEIKPSTIILPNRSDVHSDHKAVFDWCYSCTKVFRFPYIKKILSMEVLSETDFSYIDNAFIANYYVNISDYIEKKINILKLYKSELGKHPFPRSIEGIESLARVRGISAGSEYAEAFKVIKFIE